VERAATYLLLAGVAVDTPVNGAEELALMRSHLGDVHSPVGRHDPRVLVYQPRLSQHIRRRVLQLQQPASRTVKVNVMVKVGDLYSASTRGVSKALRYGTCSQGISVLPALPAFYPQAG